MIRAFFAKYGGYFGLYVLAFVIRIAAALATGIDKPPVSDEIEYFEPAASLAQGHGYAMVPQQSVDGMIRLTAYRMPGPSLVLASGFVLFGIESWVARLVCVFFASFSSPLLYRYTRQFTTAYPALVAGVICAIYPSWVYYSKEMLSEAFFVPAMIFALIWSVNSLDSKDSKSSFYAGLAWGLTTLMRPHGLPLFIAFALYSGWRTGWRPMVLSLLGFSCLMAPWFVRNLVVFGRPVLLATEAGETLLGSNNPYVLKDPELHGLWLSPMKVPQYRERLLPIQDELERNRQQNAMALQYLREHPPNIPILAFYKLRRWLTPIPKSRGMIRVLVLVSYGGLLFFLFLGLFTGAYTRSTSLLIQVTCSIFFASITIVYWGALIRGRLPLEILWIPWASLAATQFIRKWTHAPQTARIRSFSPG